MSRAENAAIEPFEPDGTWCRSFRRRIMRWYDRNARSLPWRETRDLYAIWVSEIMLQQTQVATVIDYYKQFLAKFSTVSALAAASEESVLRQWEGLGYYRRARQMHAAAKVIVEQHSGIFPGKFDQVIALPGIGRYTAAAILSFGADDRQAILEANTQRLYARLMAYDEDIYNALGQRRLWRFAEQLLPRANVGQFNQALMELGSLVCAHPEPQCSVCPVAANCQARAHGIQLELPLPKKKTKYTELTEAAVVLRDRDNLLIRQCGPDERWAGLWDFVRFPVADGKEGELNNEVRRTTEKLTGIRVDELEPVMTIKHGVTRYRITLRCFQAEIEERGTTSVLTNSRWVRLSEMGEVPLNVTARKLCRALSDGAP